MPLIRLKKLPKTSNTPSAQTTGNQVFPDKVLTRIFDFALSQSIEEGLQTTLTSYAINRKIHAAAKKHFLASLTTRCLEASIYVDMVPDYKSPSNKHEMKVMYSSADTFTKRRIFWEGTKHLKLNITTFHVSWMRQIVGKAEFEELESEEPDLEELILEEPRFEGTPLHNFNQYCVGNRRYAGVPEEVELLAREIANITFNATKLVTLDLQMQRLHPYMGRHIIRELRKRIELVPRAGMVELKIDHTLAAD